MGTLNGLIHVVGFWFVKKSDVAAVSEYAVSGEAEITLAQGKQWTEVAFTKGKMTFRQKKQRSNAGYFYEQEFAGSVPAKSVNVEGLINDLCDAPVVVKMEIQNGDIVLCGNTSVPVRVYSELSTEQGECVFSFARKCTVGILLLDGSGSGA